MTEPVRTIRDLILHRYAELVAGRALRRRDLVGTAEDRAAYVEKSFTDLKSGRLKWNDALIASQQTVDEERRCAFCGAKAPLQRQALVPTTLKVNAACPRCGRVQGPSNQFWCCDACGVLKRGRGLYQFFWVLASDYDGFWELIPEHLEGRYLGTIYYCHECAGTLDAGDLDGDGELTLLDVDHVIAQYDRPGSVSSP